jgi:hypothetical protein
MISRSVCNRCRKKYEKDDDVVLWPRGIMKSDTEWECPIVFDETHEMLTIDLWDSENSTCSQEPLAPSECPHLKKHARAKDTVWAGRVKR